MTKPNSSLSLIPDERIASKVVLLRGVKVILDRDLAELYGVETKRLNEQVSRNRSRFPEDFMFQLSVDEFKNLKSQNATSSWGGRRKPPCALTEQGVAMLSSVLKSERAVQVNIQIIRIFTRLRQILASNAELRSKIEEMDGHIQSIYKILGQLLTKEEKPKRRIGFSVDDED